MRARKGTTPSRLPADGCMWGEQLGRFAAVRFRLRVARSASTTTSPIPNRSSRLYKPANQGQDADASAEEEESPQEAAKHSRLAFGAGRTIAHKLDPAPDDTARELRGCPGVLAPT